MSTSQKRGKSEVAVIGPSDVEPAGIPALTEVANREHDAALISAAETLAHAMASGDALLQLRELVPRGQWERWVQDNFRAPAMSRQYMRLARYGHLLPADVKWTQVDALSYLRGLPSTSGRDQPPPVAHLREEALRLRAAGFSQKNVEEMLGVGKATIYRWEQEAKGEDHTTRGAIYAERKAERERQRELRKQLPHHLSSVKTPPSFKEARRQLEEASEVVRALVRTEGNEESRGALVDALTRLATALENVTVAAHLHAELEDQQEAA